VPEFVAGSNCVLAYVGQASGRRVGKGVCHGRSVLPFVWTTVWSGCVWFAARPVAGGVGSARLMLVVSVFVRFGDRVAGVLGGPDVSDWLARGLPILVVGGA
jgi:hypothetical protein